MNRNPIRQSSLALLSLRIFVGLVTFVGVGCLLLPLRTNFLLSPDWSNRFWLVALAVGLLSAAAFLRICAIQRPTLNRAPASTLRLLLTALGLVWLGYIAVLAGISLAAYLYKSRPVTVTFTVLHLQGSSDNKCPRKISLDGPPYPFNQYCAPAPELIAGLENGDQLTVSGQGTEYGLFAISAQQAP